MHLKADKPASTRAEDWGNASGPKLELSTTDKVEPHRKSPQTAAAKPGLAGPRKGNSKPKREAQETNANDPDCARLLGSRNEPNVLLSIADTLRSGQVRLCADTNASVAAASATGRTGPVLEMPQTDAELLKRAGLRSKRNVSARTRFRIRTKLPMREQDCRGVAKSGWTALKISTALPTCAGLRDGSKGPMQAQSTARRVNPSQVHPLRSTALPRYARDLENRKLSSLAAHKASKLESGRVELRTGSDDSAMNIFVTKSVSPSWTVAALEAQDPGCKGPLVNNIKPMVAALKVNAAEPEQPGLCKETGSPEFVRSRTEQEESACKKLRKNKKEPECRKSKAGKKKPAAVRPQAGATEPSHAKDLGSGEESELVGPLTDRTKPSHAKLLGDILEPVRESSEASSVAPDLHQPEAGAAGSGQA